MKFSEIFGLTKRHKNRHNLEFRPDLEGMGPLSFGRSGYKNDYAMKLSTVYRCVNCISDAVSQLPLEIYKVDKKGFKQKDRKNPSFNVLNQKPNNRMTRFVFVGLLVQSMLLKGNAFAYIIRDDKQNVSQLIFIPTEYVSIIPPKTIFEPIKYKVIGINGDIQPKDMIHLVNQTFDGVVGISTLHFAAHTLGLSYDAEQHASNFFSTGCAVAGFIKSETSLTPKQKKDIKDGWRNAFGKDNGETNGVAVLEGSLDYKPITINPADAQLLQTREFNVVDICRFFGVSPVKAGDLSKSSYSTVEATQLAFLTDTVAPLLEKIEEEFETKLFPEGNVDIKFDVSQLLRADRTSLSSYYNSMIQNGVMTINEVRRELDLPPVENGDDNFIQVNLQTLKRATSETPDDSQTIKEN